MKNKIMFVLLAVSTLGGCSTIEPAAFRGNKHYPVVSTFTDRIKVPDERVMMLDRKRFIAALNSRDMVNGFTQRFLTGYAHTAPVKVTFGKTVTNRRAYRRAKLPKTLNIRGQQFVAPTGYGIHFDKNNARIMPIIKTLGADGGLIIYHNPAVFPSYRKAYLISTAVAYDRSGKKVLQYSNNYAFAIDGYVHKGTAGADLSLDIAGIKRALLDHSKRAGREFGLAFRKMMPN